MFLTGGNNVITHLTEIQNFYSGDTFSMTTITAFNPTSSPTNGARQSRSHIDQELGAAIFTMSPSPRPCFTPQVLDELRLFQQTVAQHVRSSIIQRGKSAVHYTVLASDIPGVYNLGGDLELFVNLIRERNRESLLNYAYTCINAGHQMSMGLDLPITTIALVEGTAQGGGFEAALSCNVVIAEEGVMLGFPEVLFNLFPGMGAYSFLRQRVNTALAERIILSGNQFRAEELYEMGVIEVLAKPGQGKQKLREYILQTNRRPKVNDLIRHTRTEYNRVPYAELQQITELWVDSALDLGAKEIRTMERLVRFQYRKVQNISEEVAAKA